MRWESGSQKRFRLRLSMVSIATLRCTNSCYHADPLHVKNLSLFFTPYHRSYYNPYLIFILYSRWNPTRSGNSFFRTGVRKISRPNSKVTLTVLRKRPQPQSPKHSHLIFYKQSLVCGKAREGCKISTAGTKIWGSDDLWHVEISYFLTGIKERVKHGKKVVRCKIMIPENRSIPNVHTSTRMLSLERPNLVLDECRLFHL